MNLPYSMRISVIHPKIDLLRIMVNGKVRLGNEFEQKKIVEILKFTDL